MSADAGTDALSESRIARALRRVEGLWPNGLGAVPGSDEPALKDDADTLRALAAFWFDAEAAALDAYGNALPDGVSTEAFAAAANHRWKARNLRG